MKYSQKFEQFKNFFLLQYFSCEEISFRLDDNFFHGFEYNLEHFLRVNTFAAHSIELIKLHIFSSYSEYILICFHIKVLPSKMLREFKYVNDEVKKKKRIFLITNQIYS